MNKKRSKSLSTVDLLRRRIADGSATEGLVVPGSLHFPNSSAEFQLPAGLRCFQLDLENSSIESLPSGLVVQYRLNLNGCRRLKTLPRGLTAGSLILSGCTSLASLPEDLTTSFLDLSECSQLTSWPARGNVNHGRLIAQNCSGLQSLPPWITRLAQLNLRGCKSISALPEGLRINSWLELAETNIRTLPASLQQVSLRWKGIPIDQRIAFRPETISADEVLSEKNAERRRVLLERMGFERFLHEAEAEILDQDRDPGGERRLLRVKLEGDEDLVCVSVVCPSTARQYLIRVPPTMKTCHQAVAWTAGFDNPALYRPQLET